MNVDIRHPDFSQIIDIDAGLEKVATGYQFIEGPIWHPAEKSMIFSDIIGNTMYRWTDAEGATVFRSPSNMSNGNAYDHIGRILSCEHATSRVVRTTDDGGMEVMASHYNGKELNSPNDIVVSEGGQLYFTDPTSGRTARYGVERAPELDFQGVYRLDPETKALTLLVDDFERPNGLCFSIDENRLFINDTVRQHIRLFDVEADGTLANGQLWAETVGEGVGVPDGMKIDENENVYCCGPGGIHLFDPYGTCLGVILIPEQTANFAFGDDDRCSLYITASTSLYRVRVKVPGHLTFEV